jgi:hypothetical protein
MSLAHCWRIANNMLTIAILVVFTYPTYAFAYIGPGLGMSTIGAVLGILGSICLAIFAIVWYPIKRLIKKFNRRNKNSSA